MRNADAPTRAAAVPRWLVLVGAAVVLVFVAAMVTQYGRARSATAEASTLRGELALARAEATLGAAALDAQRGSHETARRLASSFFTDLQAQADQVPPSARAAVSSLLAQRDPTITLLSRGDPESAEVLFRMFTEYRAAIHGQGR